MLYQIEVKGHLDQRWKTVFRGFSIDLQDDGDGQAVTMMIGRVADQSELYSIIHKIQNLGVELISIQPSDSEDDKDSVKNVGLQQGVE